MSASEGNATIWSYLSPEEAYEFTVSTHILAGTFGIVCWDVLNNLNNDYRLLSKYKVSLPTVAYFVSRVSALGTILTFVMLWMAPIARCEEFQRATSWILAICIPATSLLFFFRVRAIFTRSKYVIWFFSFMWLGVLGTALAAPQAVSATSIGSTRHCTTRTLKPFAVVCVIVPLVNDTLVLLAVTVGLAMTTTHLEPTLKQGIRTAMYGEYLPAFSRAMLRDNQMYYLATVGCNLLTLVMFFSNSLPRVYRTMFVVPNVMLMNIMACRVFRNTKFSNQWVDPTITIPSIVFQQPNSNSSATHAPVLASESDNQSCGGRATVAGGKLKNGDVIEIYSSRKNISIQETRNRGDSVA